MTPAVSVIVPAFNAERTIGRAIGSVLAQTFDAFELIVCDDGSTDGTAEALAACSDTRLRVIRQANAGRGAARNRAMAEARGTFLALLDADDWWMPGKLARDVELLERSPEDVLVFANLFVVNAAGHIYRTMNGRWTVAHSGRVFPFLLQQNFVPTSTIVLPRRLAEAAGEFDPTLPRVQDWEWLLRVAALAPFRYRNEPVGWYDAHSWGSDEKVIATLRGSLAALERTAERLPDLVARYPMELARARAAAHTGIARYHESKKAFACAARAHADALAIVPGDERVEWAHAMALYEAADWTGARAALERRTAAQPWASLPRFYLGNVGLAQDDAAAAGRELERALYVGPLDQQFPECVNNLGVACWRLGDEDRARELFEQALQQREFYSDALWNLQQLGAVDAASARWTRRKVF